MNVRGVRSSAAAYVASTLLAMAMSPAEAASRPFMAQAQAVFDGLPARDRNEVFLELMATGDFNAMASNDFSGRLYDATGSFQADHDIAPTGVLTPETRRALSVVGGRIFNSWGFEFLDHPFAPASVVVPGSFGLSRSPTRNGFALENRKRTISIDFSFFADGEMTLSAVLDNLTRPAADRHVDMKVIRPTFLAVASGTDTLSSYSRYIVVRGGISGFTLSWNRNAFPNASRLAVVMANELYPRHMVSDSGRQADIFDALPGASDAADPQTFPDAVAFSGATPTNAGADTVSQAILQANQDARRRAAQEEADRQAKTEADRLVRQAEADRRAKAEQQASAVQSATELCRQASERSAVISACSVVIGLSSDPKLLERAYNRRGMAEEQTGDFNLAAADYSSVIRINPKIAGYYDNRMRAYKGAGRLDLALQDANTAVAMAPTYAFPLYGRGAVYVAKGDFSSAVRDFSAVLAINGNDASTHVERGRALVRMGDVEGGLRDFEAAHAIDPGNEPALRERGIAYARLGRRVEARSDLAAAVAAAPADAEAGNALRQLDGSDAAAEVAQPDGGGIGGSLLAEVRPDRGGATPADVATPPRQLDGSAASFEGAQPEGGGVGGSLDAPEANVATAGPRPARIP